MVYYKKQHCFINLISDMKLNDSFYENDPVDYVASGTTREFGKKLNNNYIIKNYNIYGLFWS